GMICHLAVVRDGSPVVLPTAYGRVGDTLYLHGSSANRTILAADGQQVCVAVTHLDGLVCARAAFSHSVNYRSAVGFGVAALVRDDAQRLVALRAVTQQLIPGRWEALRKPTRKELAATAVLALPLEEASVKIRTGPPADEPDDLGAGVWAGGGGGGVPMVRTLGEPEPDAALGPGIAVPDHIRGLGADGAHSA